MQGSNNCSDQLQAANRLASLLSGFSFSVVLQFDVYQYITAFPMSSSTRSPFINHRKRLLMTRQILIIRVPETVGTTVSAGRSGGGAFKINDVIGSQHKDA